MYYQALHRTITLVGALLLSSFALGCVTVVTPVSSSDATMTDQNHGLLVGSIHLTPNEKDLSPMYMKWWIEEETRGTHILLTHLPINVPFAVKVPAGSYRVTDASFHTDQGVWLTDLPTKFTVLSRECTSLGIWNLELQSGFQAGWLTRQVSDQKALAQDEFGRTSEIQGCPIVMASLDPEGKLSLRLSFHSRNNFDRP